MTRHVGALVVFVAVATQGTLLFGDEKDTQIRELKAQVQQLEQRVKELEQLVLTLKGERQAKTRPGSLRERFEARVQQDRKTYSPDELREIESLYQVANKQWKSPQAQESLKKLTEKYAKANRTGCALLYLGQMSTGEDKEKYLRRAIQDFDDCWYGDGVQVGSYARFLLATYYQQTGKAAEAAALFGEIQKSYPEAIDHNGKPLVNAIPK